jgi:hypothetical protein
VKSGSCLLGEYRQPGGLVDSEGVVLEEYEGKRRAVVSDLQSFDVAAKNVNPKVQSRKGNEC